MLGFFVSDHQGAARQSMFDENVVETNKDEDKGVGEEGGGGGGGGGGREGDNCLYS